MPLAVGRAESAGKRAQVLLPQWLVALPRWRATRSWERGTSWCTTAITRATRDAGTRRTARLSTSRSPTWLRVALYVMRLHVQMMLSNLLILSAQSARILAEFNMYSVAPDSPHAAIHDPIVELVVGGGWGDTVYGRCCFWRVGLECILGRTTRLLHSLRRRFSWRYVTRNCVFSNHIIIIIIIIIIEYNAESSYCNEGSQIHMFHNCSAMEQLGAYKLKIYMDLPFAWEDRHLNATLEHLTSELLWMKVNEYYKKLGISTTGLKDLLQKISAQQNVAAARKVNSSYYKYILVLT